jgi:hypothetical protein
LGGLAYVLHPHVKAFSFTTSFIDYLLVYKILFIVK